MSVVLYEMAHSPFCIPAAAFCAHAAIEFARREIPNGDRSAILRLTGGAYYQVPVIGHDASCLRIRRRHQDVAHYLDRTFAQETLFPVRSTGCRRS
jgi:glutaredoxin 2